MKFSSGGKSERVKEEAMNGGEGRQVLVVQCGCTPGRNMGQGQSKE